jgi:UDP-glucose 4-epimerase
VNIAFGRTFTINQVAETVARLCGRPVLKPHYIEPRPVMCARSKPTRGSPRETLGFRAEVDFEHGMQRYIDWFRERHNNFAALLEDEVRNWRMPRDE